MRFPKLLIGLLLHYSWLGGSSKFQSEGSYIYDYLKHGQEWAQGQCSSRSRQSPIDFPPLVSAIPQGKFYFSYQKLSSSYFVTNTGHTLSASLRDQGYGGVSYEEAWYDLMYINVHAISEHTFNGVHTPVELHLVHKRYDSDALLIVAIPLDCAAPPPAGGTPLAYGAQYTRPPYQEANYNKALQVFLQFPPPPALMKQEFPGDAVNGPDLIPLLEGGTFLEYFGSTTAPPCAENVLWLVRSAPIMVSDTQARYLHDVIYTSTHETGNYRSVMPVEGRMIQLRAAVLEPSPRIMVTPMPGAELAARADRQYRSMKWAKDALTVATSSLDYVRNLDQRLHYVSQASAVNLKPHLIGLFPAPSGPPAPAPAPCTAEQAAMAMAASIAQATREAVANATQQISAQAKAAAMHAAQDASKVVLENMNKGGQMGSPTAAQMQAAQLRR